MDDIIIIPGLKYSKIVDIIDKRIPFSKRKKFYNRVEESYLVDAVLMYLEIKARKKIRKIK